MRRDAGVMIMTEDNLSARNAPASVQAFEHQMFGALRVVIGDDRKTMFNLTDVCRALEINNSRQVKARLAKRGVITADTPTRNQYGAVVMQPMTYIDEANLYRCIFQSRKEEAEKFQDWVFEEVLPQIRRTGGYIPTHDAEGRQLSDEQILAVAEQIVGNTLRMLNAPSEECLTATEVARSWGMDVKSFNQLLSHMGIQHRHQGRWHLSDELEGKGLTEDRHFLYYSLRGIQKSRTYLVWTPEGVRYLNRRFLASDGERQKVIQLNVFVG